MEEQNLLEEELKEEEGGGEYEVEMKMLKLEIKRQKMIMEEQVRDTMHLHSCWVKKLKHKEIHKVIVDQFRAGAWERDKKISDLRTQLTQLQYEKENLENESEGWIKKSSDGKRSVEQIEGLIPSNPVLDFISAVSVISLDFIATLILEVAPPRLGWRMTSLRGWRMASLRGLPAYKSYQLASYGAISVVGLGNKGKVCYAVLLLAIVRVCICFGALYRVFSDEEVPGPLKISLLMLSFILAIVGLTQDFVKDKKLAAEVKQLKSSLDN